MRRLLDIDTIFSKISVKYIELIKQNMIIKSFEKGAILYGGNERCIGIPVVLEGKLRLFRVSENGREINIYRINSGQMCVLSTVCMFNDIEYDFMAEAEQNSEIAFIPNEILKTLMEECNVFNMYILKEVSTKLISAFYFFSSRGS